MTANEFGCVLISGGLLVGLIIGLVWDTIDTFKKNSGRNKGR
jgi:hypothetical protein